MSINYQNTLEQKQTLSQNQIQSLELLSMNGIELSEFMQNEYLENPLLECTGSDGFAKENINNTYEHTLASYNTFEDTIIADDGRRMDIPVHDAETIESYILSQLNRKSYTDEQWQVFKYLIDNLDETGFFTMPISDIAKRIKVAEKNIYTQLEILKNLEPYGIFSKDLQECLLKQLDVKKMNGSIEWRIVHDFFDEIAMGKFSNISRSLKITTSEVRKSLDIISNLNSRPIQSFKTSSSEYIIPDIIITNEKEKLIAEINSGFVENYKINDYYIKMIKQLKDNELSEYFANKLDRIKFIMNCIEQRKNTIIAICDEVIKYQGEFFVGKSVLNPMTMNDIANNLGIHTSTVSRAIKGKFIQYPTGTILMKNLFSHKIATNSELGVEQVKEYIKNFITDEDKAHPLSDQKIVELLSEQNINISRRVVAKYREEMGIKGSYNRKM